MNERHPLIIMAAGKGSRMKAAADVPDWVLQETRSRPKAMIRFGLDRKPMLQHLVEQARREGLHDICIVVGEEDNITRPHFEALESELNPPHFVTQAIPKGRSKPEGTAHAVQVALEAHPEWEGKSVTVANGDNLPPPGMFWAMTELEACMPAFDREFLGLPAERVGAFAVISVDERGQLDGIHEKPDARTIASAKWPDGTVRVSMNCFRMPHQEMLEAVRTVPENPVRRERELPTAISRWHQQHGGLHILPMAGGFVDLTHPDDVLKASRLQIDRRPSVRIGLS